MPQSTRPVLVLLAAAGATLALTAAGSGAAQALTDLRAGASAADPVAPLVGGLALLAQLLAAYLMVVCALALAAGWPGRLGTTARICAAKLSPPIVRRVLGVALGVTTAVATVGVGPAAAAAPNGPRAGASVPALDWPGPAPTPPGQALSLDWPTSADVAPALASPLPRAAAATPAPPAVAPTAAVTVAPGDTLWGIAARHLPAGAGDAAIAQAWPAWWSANRDAVGPDPDLITPGTHLAPPAPPVR